MGYTVQESTHVVVGERWEVTQKHEVLLPCTMDNTVH